MTKEIGNFIGDNEWFYCEKCGAAYAPDLMVKKHKCKQKSINIQKEKKRKES